MAANNRSSEFELSSETPIGSSSEFKSNTSSSNFQSDSSSNYQSDSSSNYQSDSSSKTTSNSPSSFKSTVDENSDNGTKVTKTRKPYFSQSLLNALANN